MMSHLSTFSGVIDDDDDYEFLKFRNNNRNITNNLSFVHIFYRLFGNTGACSACGQMIPANELVMRTTSNMNQTGMNNNTPANNQNIQHFVYHIKCFSCSKCGSHLVQGDR